MAKSPKKKVAKKKAKKTSKSQSRRVQVQRQTQISEGEYIATLDFNNEKYEATGTSAMESFQNLAAQIPKTIFKTRGILTLTLGERESSQLFFIIQLKRFLFSYTAMQIWAKRLEMALK